MPPMALQPASYKLKTISFGPSRRAVRVVIQKRERAVSAAGDRQRAAAAQRDPAARRRAGRDPGAPGLSGGRAPAGCQQRGAPARRVARVPRKRAPAPIPRTACVAACRCSACCAAVMAGLLRCVGTSAACCCSVRGERRRRPALEPTCSDRARSACCTRPDFHAVPTVCLRATVGSAAHLVAAHRSASAALDRARPARASRRQGNRATRGRRCAKASRTSSHCCRSWRLAWT